MIIYLINRCAIFSCHLSFLHIILISIFLSHPKKKFILEIFQRNFFTTTSAKIFNLTLKSISVLNQTLSFRFSTIFLLLIHSRNGQRDVYKLYQMNVMEVYTYVELIPPPVENKDEEIPSRVVEQVEAEMVVNDRLEIK